VGLFFLLWDFVNPGTLNFFRFSFFSCVALTVSVGDACASSHSPVHYLFPVIVFFRVVGFKVALYGQRRPVSHTAGFFAGFFLCERKRHERDLSCGLCGEPF